jgi:hypothetical protein
MCSLCSAERDFSAIWLASAITASGSETSETSEIMMPSVQAP